MARTIHWGLLLESIILHVTVLDWCTPLSHSWAHIPDIFLLSSHWQPTSLSLRISSSGHSFCLHVSLFQILVTTPSHMVSPCASVSWLQEWRIWPRPGHISLFHGLVSGRCMLTNENKSQDFTWVLTERDFPFISIDLELGSLRISCHHTLETGNTKSLN